MSLKKNLSITITNDREGIDLKITSISGTIDQVTISGDPGQYNLAELKEVINEIEKFNAANAN